MENTYLSEIPEELYTIILSYLPHDDIYKLTEHRDVHPMDIFILNYNELHIIIKKFPNYYSAIDWDIIFDDMKHIEYNKLVESLNDDNIEFNIEDKLDVLNSFTLNIIYTCLLHNKKILLDVIDMMNEEIFKSDYHSLYIYLYVRNQDEEKIMTPIRVSDGRVYKDLRPVVVYLSFFIMKCEQSDYYNKDQKLIWKFETWTNRLHLSWLYNKEESDKTLRDPLNGDYFYKLFTYFISD